MWQLRCIATWSRPTSRQSFRALTESPMVYHLIKFQYKRAIRSWVIDDLANVPWKDISAVDEHLWVFWLNVHCTCVYSVSNSVPNFSEIEQSAADLMRFQCVQFWRCASSLIWPAKVDFHNSAALETHIVSVYTDQTCSRTVFRGEIVTWFSQRRGNWTIPNFERT